MFSKLVFVVDNGRIEFPLHEIVRIHQHLFEEYKKKREVKSLIPPKLELDGFVDWKKEKTIDILKSCGKLKSEDELESLFYVVTPYTITQNLGPPPYSIDKWMSLARNLSAVKERDYPSCWWVGVAGRLLRINNKDRMLYYISDYGKIVDIMSVTRSAIFSEIPWLEKKFLKDRDKMLKSRTLSKDEKLCDEYTVILHKEYIAMKHNEESLKILKKLPESSKKIATKIVVMSEIIKKINRGDDKLLFRPLGSYGIEAGSSYRDFATSISQYVQKAKHFNKTRLACLARAILKGYDISNSDVSFLPNLIAAWFIAELARNQNSILSGLMLLDLMEANVQLIDEDGNDIYSWQHVLIHPKKPIHTMSPVQIQDMYGHKTDLANFDGIHPMAHAGSAKDARTELGEKQKLSAVRQKEGHLAIHWLYQRLINVPDLKLELVVAKPASESTESQTCSLLSMEETSYELINRLLRAADGEKPSKLIGKNPYDLKKWELLREHIIPLLKLRLESLDNLLLPAPVATVIMSEKPSKPIRILDSLGETVQKAVGADAKGYTRHAVDSDGDCGYTAFGITRADERLHATVSNPILRGLKFQAVSGNGHCLFHAVGFYLGQDHGELRNKVADYLEQHPMEFQEIIAVSGLSREVYIRRIRETSEWGDHLEIEIIQRITNRPIIIIRSDVNPIIPENVETYENEPMFIYYNGYTHYDSFILREGENPREILRAIQARLQQGEKVIYDPTQFDEHSRADAYLYRPS